MVSCSTSVTTSCRPRTEPAIQGAQGRQILDETTWLLQDAVRLRLRSDVPIAGSLSGGLDSSLLTALIVEDRRSAPPPQRARPALPGVQLPVSRSCSRR